MLKRNKPDHDDSIEKYEDPFQRSKLVARTPPKEEKEKTIQENGNMEEIKNMLMEIRTDIKGVKESMSQSNEEVRKMREQMGTMQEEWKREKAVILEQLQRAEEKIEKLEKTNIRNNLIVTGVKTNRNTEKNPRRAVEDMIESELNIKVKVKGAYQIGQERYIVETECWEDKLQILIEKKNLKGKNIYIESEMTSKERKIQKIIRDIAREERSRGANVRVRFQKIIVNGKTMKWDIASQKLIDTEPSHTSKN